MLRCWEIENLFILLCWPPAIMLKLITQDWRMKVNAYLKSNVIICITFWINVFIKENHFSSCRILSQCLQLLPVRKLSGSQVNFCSFVLISIGETLCFPRVPQTLFEKQGFQFKGEFKERNCQWFSQK